MITLYRGLPPLTRQIIRYGINGVLVNLTLYGLYFVITTLGVGHKVAASLTYGIGVLLSFLAHRTWTFRSQGHWTRESVRFVATYLSGYAVQLLGLFLLVDGLGMDHRIAQALMILVVAAFLFILQRMWVFTLVESDSRPDTIRD